ncbi:MAG: membrane protein insertase YidC, partial [Bradyrhizobium sp.]
MLENRNTIVAIILSGLVLIAWQYFYNGPQMAQHAAQQRQAELVKRAQPKAAPTQPRARPSSTPSNAPPAGPAPSVDHSASNAAVVSRAAALARTTRVKIETPTLSGSISLKGARIDDLKLVKFHKTVDPSSPAIILYSPSGTAHPYYAEFGWVAAAGSTVRVPDEQTMWQQVGTGSLTPSTPVVLKYDNGQG